MSAIIAARKKAADRKARRLAKALRLQAARQIVTASGEALTIPPRWTLKTLRSKLQTELNAAIRARDGAVCISSGKAPLSAAEWQAGHLFAVGPFPSVRFHPLNIHSQSSRDNCYLGGNHAAYAVAFVKRYGIETFIALAEAANKPAHFSAGVLYELLTILRREGLAGYTARYYALTGWNEGKAA